MKKLFLFLIIVYAKNIACNDKDYYDPNDEDDNVILWKGLFTKLNTLLLETQTINQNVLDLNQRLDQLNKRQDDQEQTIKELMTNFHPKESLLAINQRQDDQERQLIKLITNLDVTSQHVNASLREFTKRQKDQDDNVTKLITGINLNIEHLKENLTQTKLRENISKELIVQSFSHAWTTILRRQDGSVDFSRLWSEYKKGFGDRDGEFFIGLDKLYIMTTYGAPQELLIILEDWKNQTRYAKYDHFRIGSEMEYYAIMELGNYSGNAGDSLTKHTGFKFSTADHDNDSHDSYNCAKGWKGAWWYYDCYRCHLTGPYRNESESTTNSGIEWNSWEGKTKDHSLKFAEMLIRTKI